MLQKSRHITYVGARGAAPRSTQRGVVLLATLMLLLLVTIVTYDVMETSALEARMSVAREGKEVSFQAAESIIDQAKNDQPLLISAYLADLAGSTWPQESFTFANDSGLTGTVEVRYRAEISALGNDLVIGNPGLRSLHFELEAETGRGDDRLDSRHVQGIRRFAPKLP